MLLEEAVALRRASGDEAGVARTLPALSTVALTRHDYERALAVHEEGVALARKTGDDFAVVVLLMNGALVHLGLGDHRLARALSEEALELSRPVKTAHTSAGCLDVSAAVAGAQGRPARSARLWGAAKTLREAVGISLSPVERSFHEPYVHRARAQLGEEAWAAAWAEGRAMTPEQAVEYALEAEEEPAPPSSTAPAPSYPGGLSPREAEVLKLVAEGLTNAQIAKELFISPRTVHRHLNSIYSKLDVGSRAAATRFALEHDLA